MIINRHLIVSFVMSSSLYQSNRFLVATYSKSSQSALRVDAQVTVIEAALKGLGKWKSKSHGDNQQHVCVFVNTPWGTVLIIY